MQRAENRHFEHGFSHIEHKKPHFTWWTSEPRFMAIGIAKRTILDCKTHHFALQNWHFWNAKLAVLERKTGTFGMQSAPFCKMISSHQGFSKNFIRLLSSIYNIIVSPFLSYHPPLRGIEGDPFSSAIPPLGGLGGLYFLLQNTENQLVKRNFRSTALF